VLHRLRRWIPLLFIFGLLLCFGIIAQEVVEAEPIAFDRWIMLAFRQASDPALPIGPRWLPEAARDIVDDAIKKTPADALGAKLSAAEAEAQAKWPALAEIAKAEADARARTLAETHETMRIEAASGDIVQRWWRPIYAFELTLECAICWALAIWDLAFGTGKIAAWAVNASGLLSVYWGAL
jgi:Holin of 3TMs, for gene-transfer release